MVLLLTGIAIFVNFWLMYQKGIKGLYFPLLIDIIVLTITTFVFSGTYSGMAAGYIGNALFSLYLLFFPTKFSDLHIVKEMKKREKKKKFDPFEI